MKRRVEVVVRVLFLVSVGYSPLGGRDGNREFCIRFYLGLFEQKNLLVGYWL